MGVLGLTTVLAELLAVRARHLLVSSTADAPAGGHVDPAASGLSNVTHLARQPSPSGQWRILIDGFGTMNSCFVFHVRRW